MKILIGCEESQSVTIELRKRGHEAYSCDLLPCSGGHPEWHLQWNITDAIKMQHLGWDMIIMHPPCTALAVSGNRWYGKGMVYHHERVLSLSWTKSLWKLATTLCDKVVMENPVGVLSGEADLPKPQYIQPWQFGHGETKKTGLWIHGLPHLVPTDIVEGREQRIWKLPPTADRAKIRSKTFPGIAKAMAEQWAPDLTQRRDSIAHLKQIP